MSFLPSERLKRTNMPRIQKIRKWHFLFLGSALIFLSGFLWYWNWRVLGIPFPIRPEHFATILSAVVGFAILGVLTYRLNRKQVTIMLVGVMVVNLLFALATRWIFQTFPAFFNVLSPGGVDSYDPALIEDWRLYFVTPAIIVYQSGLLLLWVISLLMFLVRKPTDNPE